MRVAWVLALLVGLLGLCACGSGSSNSAPTTTSAGPGSTVTDTVTVTTTAGPSSSATTGSSTTTGAQNLVVSNAVRAQLLAAGAALHQLPVSDYLGLRHGESYYAYDPATKTYWAGAGLRASSASLKAQVGDQDDGAYLDFRRLPGGTWHAFEAGIPGQQQLRLRGAYPTFGAGRLGLATGDVSPDARVTRHDAT